MELTDFLAWVALACVPLNVVATLLLLKTSRKAPSLRVLKERYIVAAITTFVVLFFALVFVNNDQTVPPLSLQTTKVVTRIAMIAMGTVPAVGWILLYRAIGRSDKAASASSQSSTTQDGR
jgi:hypothetical protein